MGEIQSLNNTYKNDGADGLRRPAPSFSSLLGNPEERAVLPLRLRILVTGTLPDMLAPPPLRCTCPRRLTSPLWIPAFGENDSKALSDMPRPPPLRCNGNIKAVGFVPLDSRPPSYHSLWRDNWPRMTACEAVRGDKNDGRRRGICCTGNDRCYPSFRN